MAGRLFYGAKMTKKLKLPALHIAQQKVWEGRARYNVVCLGRRSGKTALGIMLALGASGCCDLAMGALQGVPVGWFAPTYKVLDLAWRESKQRLNPIITNKNEQSTRLEIMGGGTIDFWSLEDEDAGRGRKYARVIIDEAGIAKRLQPTWENAIRPTLTDLGGDAWFYQRPKDAIIFTIATNAASITSTTGHRGKCRPPAIRLSIPPKSKKHGLIYLSGLSSRSIWLSS